MNTDLNVCRANGDGGGGSSSHGSGRSVEATPKHLIIVDGAIMQAIPEHPKRDYIFCLSTAFGDAYLFQVITATKLEKGNVQKQEETKLSFALSHWITFA